MGKWNDQYDQYDQFRPNESVLHHPIKASSAGLCASRRGLGRRRVGGLRDGYGVKD